MRKWTSRANSGRRMLWPAVRKMPRRSCCCTGITTSTMWSPNIANFSRDYRVYAVDVMGQPSTSIPEEPIRNAAGYAAWLTTVLDGVHLAGSGVDVARHARDVL